MGAGFVGLVLEFASIVTTILRSITPTINTPYVSENSIPRNPSALLSTHTSPKNTSTASQPSQDIGIDPRIKFFDFLNQYLFIAIVCSLFLARTSLFGSD